ncbi:unnamed protein product [Closterium sp. Naga37s-1]|nr:unnamed protein product [Closterium sp. Naga37s-1]
MTGRQAIEESLAIVSDDEATQSKNILPSVTQQLTQSGNVLGPCLKDPRMEAQDDLVLKVLQLALRCTAKRSATRPSMGAIAAELEGVLAELIGSKRNAAVEERPRRAPPRPTGSPAPGGPALLLPAPAAPALGAPAAVAPAAPASPPSAPATSAPRACHGRAAPAARQLRAYPAPPPRLLPCLLSRLPPLSRRRRGRPSAAVSLRHVLYRPMYPPPPVAVPSYPLQCPYSLLSWRLSLCCGSM